jgi:hypothetical protein
MAHRGADSALDFFASVGHLNARARGLRGVGHEPH